jgi:hypothetical protein
MVVSFDIYAVLNVVELIVVLIFGVFIFFKRQETFNKVIRLITTSILLIINVFQLPMEIQMDKSYGLTIFLIIIWFINALMVTYDLGSDN